MRYAVITSKMALDALENNDFSLWSINGGNWFTGLKDAQQKQAKGLLDACRDLPHIIEITCKNGLNVIAHAGLSLRRIWLA